MRATIAYSTASGKRAIPLIVSPQTNWAGVREAARRDGAVDMAEVDRAIAEARG